MYLWAMLFIPAKGWKQQAWLALFCWVGLVECSTTPLSPSSSRKRLFPPISVYPMLSLLSAVSIPVFVVSGILGSASPVSGDKLVVDTRAASLCMAVLSFVGL